jgi:hypothetical protein
MRGKGLGGEIADLRSDLNRAFDILEDSVDIHTEPIKLSPWLGDLQTHTLLDVDHIPNIYDVRVVGSILSNDGNGIFTITTNWHDPDLGDLEVISDNILVSSATGPLVPFSRPFWSDGVSPITAKIEGFGTWPTAGVALYLQIARIG